MTTREQAEDARPGEAPVANGEADGNGDGYGGEDGEPKPYHRAQARLRVDGPAFGRAVDALREERGWSVRELSKRSGIPLTTVAKLLRGETEQPDAEVACALSYTFGFPNPGALLGRPGTRGGGRAAGAQAQSGPGPMSLAGLIEGLLRGVWAAQDSQRSAQPGAGVAPEAPGPDLTTGEVAVEVKAPAAAGAPALGGPAGVQDVLRRVGGHHAPVLAVGVVVLNEPRTLG